MKQHKLIKTNRLVAIQPQGLCAMPFPVTVDGVRMQRGASNDHAVVLIPYTEMEMRNRRDNRVCHVQCVNRRNLKSA